MGIESVETHSGGSAEMCHGGGNAGGSDLGDRLWGAESGSVLHSWEDARVEWEHSRSAVLEILSSCAVKSAFLWT